MKRKFLSLTLLIFLFLEPFPHPFQESTVSASYPAEPAEKIRPTFIYLTWSKEDTSTTMAIHYHTLQNTSSSEAYYDTRSGKGKYQRYRFHKAGSFHHIQGVPRTVHTIELTGLKGGTTYYFIAGSKVSGFSKEFKFRTIPEDNSPLRFVTGGDMSVGSRARKIAKQAALQNPYFAMLGGDLAYANGKISRYKTWDSWLKNWTTIMKDKEGHLIPMVLAIGNHEVRGHFMRTPAQAPFYFGYFHQNPKRSYFRRYFGKNMVLYTLDSGHAASHGGDQAKWLEKVLKEDEKIPYKFALYHVPLYPSHRIYLGPFSALGRLHWLPLFDRYHMTACFENHDHTFKRSKILKDNKVSQKGTLYLGDGCWGVKPRTVTERWYLEKLSSTNHIWRIDLNDKGSRYTAIDSKGKELDQCFLKRD